VYQKHEFLAERKDALEQWGRHVADIIATSSKSHSSLKPQHEIGRTEYI